MAEKPVSGQFKATWDLDEARHVEPVNQFILQRGMPSGTAMTDDLVYVVFGHTYPPVILGTEEERNARLVEGGSLQVRHAGTFAMSRTRAREFVRLFTAFLDKTDEEEGQYAELLAKGDEEQ